MKHSTPIGCLVVLCAFFIGSANAATTQFNDTLDLTNLQYPVTVGTISGDAAADILRFDVGTGWSGVMEILLTTSTYSDFTTSLGVALTTDPNDVLFNDPSPFLQLAQPNSDVTAFFNANVIDWVFYSWGTPNITAGGTSDITSIFSPPLQFNPNEHYYAFVAGGSVAPTTVDVELTVSSVPIPAAVWLFGSGVIGLVAAARRKRTQTAT
jgi:hypothetical protein